MADEARLPDAQRSCALLIGVSEFTDDQLSDLPSVRNNLTGLFEVLTSPWGVGLPGTHCTMLADPGDMRTVGDRNQPVSTPASPTGTTRPCCVGPRRTARHWRRGFPCGTGRTQLPPPHTSVPELKGKMCSWGGRSARERSGSCGVRWIQ